MLWSKKVVSELLEKTQREKRNNQLINDSWTPSGPVHIGSLLSPIIHEALYQLLKEKEEDVSYQIGFDDFDPFDGIPATLDHEKYKPYLGKPLFDVPSEEGGKSFAEFYIEKYKKIEEDLNLSATNYRTSELYKEGKFDPYIKLALENADKIRIIYKEVSGSTRSGNWLPFQPICQNCGKLGSTEAISFDGEKVEYICRPSLVTWAQGCGHEGQVSPFGGAGKMPWRVEWAAKWALFDVTLEAAGKDHASKGSSFDVSTEICEQIFGKEAPYKLAHEFLTIEGKKMASSKGLGLFSDEVLHLFSPEILRFIMLRTPPAQAREFDLRNPNVVLRYFDEFDRFRNSDSSEEKEIYRLSTGNNETYFVPRFALFIQWVQMPNIEVQVESEKLKGSQLTEKEKGIVDARSGYAKYWLEHYAPDEEKFAVQKALPDEFENLTNKQKEFLTKVAEKLGNQEAEEFQNEIYQLGKDLGLSSSETFQAVYIALLGKKAGPKAAWLILSLGKDFIKKRFTGQG